MHAAAAKLTKTSTLRDRAEGSIETADVNRITSTLEKAKQRADELRAMRRIGEALHALDTVDTPQSKSLTYVTYHKSVPTSLRNT